MSDIKRRNNKDSVPAFKLPEKCGVIGCNNPCDVYIKQKNVARCSMHYQNDVDEYGKHHLRGSAQRFTAEPEIMERLKQMGLEQYPTESKHEYAMRCKAQCLEMMKGKTLGSLLTEGG